MPAADADPLLVEKIPQHPTARKREFEVQLVHPAHDGQIGRRHRSGQVIDAATADPKRLGLLGDRQIMGAVDHRFALSRPALLSAPDKKSLVSVNSPILACSVFEGEQAYHESVWGMSHSVQRGGRGIIR